MNKKSTKIIAAAGLITGAIFGMVGSFVPAASLRGLAWGIDGIGLVLAAGLLTIYYFRKEQDITACGFLIFAIGQGLVLAYSGIDLNADVSLFGAGAGLWATALFVISSQKTYPVSIRCAGILTAVLFSIVAVQIFTHHTINALSRPLPFFAYPVLVITILGWAWTLLREQEIQQPIPVQFRKAGSSAPGSTKPLLSQMDH